MATSREIMKIVGLAGLALLIGQGCSQKSVNVTADSETFEQGAQYAENQQGWSQGQDNVGGENGQQYGSQNYGTNQNGANAGPLAGLQEYGGSWNQGQGGALANEFIQEDYDSIAEAQPLSPSDFAQEGRYGDGAFSQGTQVELQDVFFEFNSWRISSGGRQALAQDAEWLDQNHARSLTVEGHCDQRGTRDYNLVLGKKRAQAVQAYLVDLGVQSHKVQVISYGKERPFCFGNDDQCYQLNRRGHLQLHH
ncbi:MAG: OmpA family protein [Nitrospirae bacterium]|nr:OmpA family protein [Nitrospirota bacterium]MDA1303190.1 OmpA family protein [Nitrospirota bacterium]